MSKKSSERATAKSTGQRPVENKHPGIFAPLSVVEKIKLFHGAILEKEDFKRNNE
ncbi:MAG: hypothetical protein HQ522_08700 [Bacteroidetes bacterium]|nr:hypothetical protein [Bacteroidota bacterium]